MPEEITPETPETPETPDALGDAGKQAIERMKAERNSARAEAKVWKDLGLTVEEIRALKEGQASAPDEATIERRLRTQIETEARERTATKFRASAVRETAATLGFIDPRDALALLPQAELAQVDVDDNDDVDSDAVKKLLEDLAKRKPHLLKPTDTTVDHRSAGIGGAGSGTVPEVPAGQARIAFAYANTPKK